MYSLSLFISAYVIVWTVVSAAWFVLKGKQFGLEGPPLYLVWRTTRFNRAIARIAGAWRSGWRVTWNVGVVVGVGSMAYVLYTLVKNLFSLLVQPSQAIAVQPIVPVPGVFIRFETFPYLALALSVVLISHELSHGIASLADHVPLKSSGMFFAHVLFGGFVEPDDEKLSKAPSTTKLRVFAAGSFTNLVLGVLFVILLTNFLATMAPFYTVVPEGVSVGGVVAGLPASGAGVLGGDVVNGINSTRVLSLTDMQSFMNHVRPGSLVVISTGRGVFTIRTTSDPNNSTHAIIGISGLTNRIGYSPKLAILPSTLPPIILNTEYWLSIVLVSVALFNMLPVYPFDGGRFVETLVKALKIRHAREVQWTISGLSAAVLLLNIGLSLLRFGFVRY
jgi:membrane-associated protease RseP (regulator of RpoE activity)